MGYGYVGFNDSADAAVKLFELARRIDPSCKLPCDCVAAAAQRIRDSYSGRGCLDARDLYILCGDPCKGVVVPTSGGEVKEQLEEVISERKKLFERLQMV